MSDQPDAWNPSSGAGAGTPGGLPGTSQARRAVASFATYREAERAVDLLSDRGFPVERVAIVGRDLQLVEQVTGRMGHGQAAPRGALQGAVLGLLTHAMTGGRRDFASVSGMQASHYDVLVDEEVADQAAQILAQHPTGGS